MLHFAVFVQLSELCFGRLLVTLESFCFSLIVTPCAAFLLPQLRVWSTLLETHFLKFVILGSIFWYLEGLKAL